MSYFLSCFLAFIVFLYGCSPESFDDFQREGERWSHQMSKELISIETREELIARLPRLEKLYEELAELLIEARSHQLSQTTPESFAYRNSASEELRAALERVYQIEGGRELMEKAQQEAAERLARFEEQLVKNPI